jgi:CheY-like chemotaxis protein
MGQGTGLGLSMMYGFAQQSGGHVRIESAGGQGTEVCIYLPRHHGRATPTRGAGRRAGRRRPAPGAGGRRRAHRAHAGDRGAARSRLPALEAADGSAGLELLNSSARIDLLISDVGLPGMNGRQLADAARVRRPELKVLFITGYAEASLLTHGQLEAGMSVLTKPFVVETLATRIRELVAG